MFDSFALFCDVSWRCFRKVILHVEGNVHLHRNLVRIRDLGGSPSVALNPHTPAEMVENVLDLVDHGESRCGVCSLTCPEPHL